MTTNTLSEFWRIIRAYWYIGNDKAQHLVRQIILTVLGGGALLMYVALLGVPWLTATVTLVLLIGGPARMLWKFKYPLTVPVGAIVLSKIDEDAWKLVKEVAWRATQALTLFGLVALYFSSPLSPFLKLPVLERLYLVPIFMLAFVVAGLCYLVGWRTQSTIILALTAASSLLIRVGGWDEAKKSLTRITAELEGTTSPITLGPGSGCISIPDDTREIVVNVPPGDWTMGVPRPQGATCFWARPQNSVEMAMYYGDGTCKWVPDFQTYMDIPNQRAQKVTEMRFRNSRHSVPVQVRIQFKD